MANPRQQEAAFNFLFPKLQGLVALHVPPFFQYQVMQMLNDPNTKQQIMLLIDQTLNVAENTQ